MKNAPRHEHHYTKVGDPWRRQRGPVNKAERTSRRKYPTQTFYEKPMLQSLLCHCGHVAVVQIRPH